MKIPGYKIQQQIGEGGMATAYLAVQDSLGRAVVLKILNKTNPEHVERFLNEGRIIASLNHPNIITIYDIGIAGDYIYMSMEYVEGGDLRGRTRNIISPAEALDIITKIGSGLSAAHKKGIVHRDVKPANILFRKDETPLLSDFGIAKQLTVNLELTSAGIFLGSPNYMAPEQAEAGPIDGRADIYSLGIIFYEMLTGSRPYYSDSIVDIIVQHKQAPIPQLPPGLEQFQPLLNLMIAKNRKDRFRDVDSMLHYIRHAARNGSINTTSELIIRRPSFEVTGEHQRALDTVHKHSLVKSRSSRRTRYVLGIILFLLLMGYGALFYVESVLNLGETSPGGIDPAANNIQSLPTAIEPLAVQPPTDILTPKAGPVRPVKDPTTAEVVKALSWLAKKSLDDYRLTYPPKDNAYYYYSRLLEIDPGNQYARQGLLKIADRFALLAERELAENNYERAQGYVTIGLQINPNNQTLLTLQSLAKPRHKSLPDRIFDLFRSG